MKTSEYHLSAANLFLGERLSLGMTVIVGQNVRVSPRRAQGPSLSRLGDLEPDLGHFTGFQIGFSWAPVISTPIHYSINPQGDVNPLFGNFFQAAEAPYRLGLGVGWLPNRFFRTSADLYIFGSTDNTALLSDDSRLVGVNMTLQPRLGFFYKAVEYRNFAVELSAGTYLEVLRVQDDFSRLHGTMAIEIKPWVLNFGWGLDEARFYQNFIYSAGVDVGKLLRRLDLIPPEPNYAYGGILPNPTRISEDGMPHAFVQEWKPRDDNVFDVGRRMPEKIRDRIRNAPEDIKNLGNDVLNPIEPIPFDS